MVHALTNIFLHTFGAHVSDVGVTACSDVAPFLLFAGEPGIGKSHALHEVEQRAQRAGWQGGVTRVTCATTPRRRACPDESVVSASGAARRRRPAGA
jgi:hypothetical protein